METGWVWEKGALRVGLHRSKITVKLGDGSPSVELTPDDARALGLFLLDAALNVMATQVRRLSADIRNRELFDTGLFDEDGRAYK